MLYDILADEWIEEAPEVLAERFAAAQASNTFLDSLRESMGQAWPCGHSRVPDNTHTIGGIGQCKTCRRKRWNSAMKRRALFEQAKLYREAEHRAYRKKVNAERDARMREMIEVPSGRRLPIDEVKALVAIHFDMTVAELIGKARTHSHACARAVVVKVLLERGCSYPQAGRLLGKRDHTTILNSKRKWETYLRTDRRTFEAYMAVRDGE